MLARFDTIKVRLQTSSATHFRGPAHCLVQTLRNEGVQGLYKGATPPLIGWMFMDSMYVLYPNPSVFGQYPSPLTELLATACSAP